MCLVRVFIFVRKAEHMYEITIFKSRERTPCISLRCSSLFITTYIPSIPSTENQTPALLISIDASKHPRLSFTFVGSHLHRQHSKIQPEIELLSLPTHHSKIQVRISLSPCSSMGFGAKSKEFLLHSDVCFLVFVFLFFFVFPHQSRKPIFIVLCLLLRWSFDLQSKHTCLTFSKSRRVFSTSFAVETIFSNNPFDLSFFLTLSLVAEKASED